MVLRRATAYSSGLAALLVAVVLTSATVGQADVGYRAVALAVLNGLPVPLVTAEGVAWTRPFAFPVSDTTAVIVRRVRLPRIALGAIVGFALALAGAVMQGFFRNPCMTAPSIIGVSTGAAVGAVAFIVLPLSVPFGLPAFAFVGALLSAFGVYLIATEGGRTPVATLLLAGVAVQAFLGAVISYLLQHAGDGLETAIY